MPIVSLPATRVARLAGAQAFGDGEGEGAGDGEAAAGLGLASGLAAMLAAGLGEGEGVGVAAPEQAVTSAPVSASATAKRIGVRMVLQTLLRDGTGESVPEPRTSPGFVAGRRARLDSERACPDLRDAAPGGGPDRSVGRDEPAGPRRLSSRRAGGSSRRGRAARPRRHLGRGAALATGAARPEDVPDHRVTCSRYQPDPSPVAGRRVAPDRGPRPPDAASLP